MKNSSNSFRPGKNARLRRWVLSAAILIGFACGPVFDPGEYMSFFQPEASNAQPQDHRYFFSPQLYSDDELAEQYETVRDDENIRAWATYVKNSLPDTVISRALYEEDAQAVAQLIRQVQRINPAAVTYLKLAWAADGNAVPDNNATVWNPAVPPTDSTRDARLLDEARRAYGTTTDAFLKERYAFQAVKLAAETGDYRQAQQLYDQLIKPLPRRTFISDWALSRRAGASLALGDTALAIYEFAQVFDRCPSRRKAAETSLRQHGIRFDEEALAHTHSDRERAAVYALCAIQPHQDGLGLLKEIVSISPKNPLIELVMAREINRNEYYFFTSADDANQYGIVSSPDSVAFGQRKDEAASYFDKLRQFALESAENKALNDPAFWYTAAAYLDYVGKDYKAAQTHLDQAALTSATNNDLKNQIAVQRMLLLSAQTGDRVSPAAENQLIGYLEAFDSTADFRLNNAYMTVGRRFASAYLQPVPQQGGWLSGCSRSKTATVDSTNRAKAYLLTILTTQPNNSAAYFANQTDPLTLEDTVRASTVRQVLAFADQPAPSDFDRRLLKLARVRPDDLNRLLGRRLMADHQYAEAADAFARVDPATWKNEAFTTYFRKNPFTVNMPRLYARSASVGSGIDFPAEPTANPYTPVTFARRMADLEKQAKAATGDRAADLYYQLGCGAWNLSWHGNAWLLQRAYRSSGEPLVYGMPGSSPEEQQYRYDALLKTDYYTTDRARQYFEKAAKVAQTPAVADRAAYMAARCEVNAFGVERTIEQVRNGYVADDDSAFVSRMQTLRDTKYATDYRDYQANHTRSAFHREMLRECPLYVDFLSPDKIDKVLGRN